MKKKLNIFKTFKRDSQSSSNTQSSPTLTQHRGNRDTSSATSDVGSDIQTPTSPDTNDVHSDSAVTLQFGRRNFGRSASDSNLEQHHHSSSMGGNGSQRRTAMSPLAKNLISSSDLVNMNNNGKVYKSGILKKEGKKMRSWKKRNFQLLNDGIYCSQTKNNAGTEKFVTSKIALDKFTIVSVASDKKKYAFQVSNQKKSYYLRAESESERNDWINSIREVIDQLSSNSSGLVGSANSSDTSDKLHSPLHATSINKETTDEEYEINSEEEDDEGEEGESEDARTGSSTSSSLMGIEESQQINRVASLKMARLFSDSTSITSPTSPMDEHSSPSASFNETRRQTSADTTNFKNQGSNATNSPTTAPTAAANNVVMLSIEDEYDIAVSAAQIFMKNEEDRTPEEQAYVLAMKQYTNVLMAHCCKHHTKPEYSLASGTAIFVVPDALRSYVEKEYVADICNETLTQMELVEKMKKKNSTNNATATSSQETKMKELPMEHQIEIARRAHEILDKPHYLRTNEEQEYVNQLRSVLVDVNRLEREHGLNVQYSYGLSGTLMLAKYEQERTMQDWEFWSATTPQK